MELGLSLGEAPARSPPCAAERSAGKRLMGLDLGFCMGLGVGSEEEWTRGSYADPRLQLALLPPTPAHQQIGSPFPWAIETAANAEASNRGFDVNRVPSSEAEEGAARSSSSPNSGFSTPGSGGAAGEEGERASSRASDDEDNNSLARKKLRLSKDQSAFLEESFKEHNTLNPKQKLALAKQLNLRPRQVEVWFQNRRARTKLKQTEVDCEYLKRCCETLTAENRRLQKELSELRALKTATHPMMMQLPATTLSMCPSCERISSSTPRRHIFPFSPSPSAAHQPSAAS